MNQMVSNFRNLFSPPPLPLPRERYRLRLGQAAERPDFAALLRTRQGLLAGDASPADQPPASSQPPRSGPPAGPLDGTRVSDSRPPAAFRGLALDEEPSIEIAYLDELEVDEAPTERLNRREVIAIRLNEAFERARRDPDLIVAPPYAPAVVCALATDDAPDSSSDELEAELADILDMLEQAEHESHSAPEPIESQPIESQPSESQSRERQSRESRPPESDPPEAIEIIEVDEVDEGSAASAEAVPYPDTSATLEAPLAPVELTPVELDFEDLIFIDEVVGEVEAMRTAVNREERTRSEGSAPDPATDPTTLAAPATLTALRVAVRRDPSGAARLEALPADRQAPDDAVSAIVLPLTSEDGLRLAAMLGAD